MLTKQVVVTNTRPEHYQGIRDLLFAMYGEMEYPDCYTLEHLAAQNRRFPDGQFVALLDGQVVGFAITMRTNYAPERKPLTWDEAIGDLSLRRHESGGQWLYGVDFAVHPAFRKRGIGTKMYKARFNLVRRLNLRGFYAGGMLQGYKHYRRQMTVREYGEKVIRGEIQDPTVTMQMNRGFKPQSVIENYCFNPDSNDGAMLIYWPNPAYRRVTEAVPAARRMVAASPA